MMEHTEIRIEIKTNIVEHAHNIITLQSIEIGCREWLRREPSAEKFINPRL